MSMPTHFLMNKLQTHNRLFLRQNCAFIRSFYGREGLPIFLKKQKTSLSNTLSLLTHLKLVSSLHFHILTGYQTRPKYQFAAF